MSSWKNPFCNCEDEPLSNISSGQVSPDDVSLDILNAHNTGHNHLRDFICDRLVNGTVGFHEPLKKLRLKSFADLTKRKPVHIKGKAVIVQANHGFFSPLLAVAQSCSFDLKHVFQYSLGPVPWALATTDGQLAKTQNAKLMEALEKTAACVDSPPSDAR